MDPVRATIWNERSHERCDERVSRHHPDGSHRTIAEGIALPGSFDVPAATGLRLADMGRAPDAHPREAAAAAGVVR